MALSLLCEAVELVAGIKGYQLKLLRVCSCYGTMLVNCVPLLLVIRPFKSHQVLHIIIALKLLSDIARHYPKQPE